ncbi:putative tyramine receptor 2 [Trichonephila clavipes]|nr:putative tyramine receptor 2 [Trichonephila clavipes]
MEIILEEDIVEALDNNADSEAFEDYPMSPLEAVSTAVVLAIIILATIIGNVLVIISVFTYRPLQNVQNMFIVSLAVADITVAVLVMPLNVAYTLMAQWKFGLPICKMWLTCDVLCCTASILHLSAIALDRYWAIHDPINYASKRTLKRVLIMIAAVWVVSMIISAPPLIGWNDWPEDFTEETPCMLTEERGYVIYSASGSFFIPLVIMTVVYVKIFEAAKDRLRHKAKAAEKLAVMRKSPDTTSTIPLKSMQSEISTIAVTDESTSSSANNKGSDEKIEAGQTGKQVVTTKFSNTLTVEPPKTKSRTLVPDGNPRLTATVRHYMKEKQKICLQKERRAARVLGIVMGVFVVCWLPFFLMYVILPFCESCSVSNRVVNMITWLGYFNSALNPVIYTAFNTDFRKAFIYILCRRT